MTISPDILAAQTAYAARPFSAYVKTHYSGGANRYYNESEMWSDALRIMQTQSLVGNYPTDSRAELRYPDGRKIALSPYALHSFL